MARSLFDLLMAASAGSSGSDLGDHALADLAADELALALELGWASLPPAVAASLTPPSEVATDLDATAADLLAAVLVAPPALDVESEPAPFADEVLDTAWGTGTAADEVHELAALSQQDADAEPEPDLDEPVAVELPSFVPSDADDHHRLVPDDDAGGHDEGPDWLDDLDG